MIQPTFAEFSRLAKQGNLIPVYDVFSADLLTPVSAYLRIAQGARYSFLLESVEGGAVRLRRELVAEKGLRGRDLRRDLAVARLRQIARAPNIRQLLAQQLHRMRSRR